MLAPDQLADFNQKGFIVLKELFCDDDLDPVERDLHKRLDELAAHLKVDLDNGSESISSKMMELERNRPGASLMFVHSNIIDAGLFRLWSSPKILDVVESVLGKDIDGHPFFSVRPKPPEVDLFVVPWHQDSSYLADGAQSAPQLTFWTPLVDATLHNGCMEMAVGAHRDGERRHVAEEYEELGNASWYLQIEPSVVSSFKTEFCEVNRGDVIMFTQLTPHRSLPNLSDSCRWSIDMRYMQAGNFPGTTQSPVPFRRADAGLDGYVAEAQTAFRQGQEGRDRTIWRDKVARAVWKERWA